MAHTPHDTLHPPKTGAVDTQKNWNMVCKVHFTLHIELCSTEHNPNTKIRTLPITPKLKVHPFLKKDHLFQR